MPQPELSEVLGSPVRRLIVDFLGTPRSDDDPAPADPAGVDHAGRAARAVTEVAEHLGVHVTTARFHLDQLTAAGLVESRSVRTGVGRPRNLYTLRPGSLQEAGSEVAFERLAELLAGLAAKRSLTPESAGQAWAQRHTHALLGTPPEPARSSGQWIGKIGQMVDVLGDWGYTPEISLGADGRSAQVRLRDCPFISLAHQHPEIVCGVHLGLIRGALSALGEDDAEVGLEPFIGPNLCLAHLRTRAVFDRGKGRRGASVRPASVPDGTTEPPPTATTPKGTP